MNNSDKTTTTTTSPVSDGGHPVARPAVTPTDSEQGPLPAPDGQVQLGTDPPVGRTPSAAGSNYTKPQRRALLAQLSPRDRSILLGLSAHRYLSTDQLRKLFFHEHKTPQAAGRATIRVLHRLLDHQLIMRLQRGVGGINGGSNSFVWAVTDRGEKVIGDLNGVTGKRRRYDQPSTQHLNHLLAVTDARLALIEGDRAGQFAIVKTEMEPQCWRPYLNRHGQPAHIKPDLYAITQTPDYEDHWMIEIDRDTEHLPVIIRKCLAAQLYHGRGIEQERHGVFPLTVWVVPDEKRRHNIESAIERTVDLSSELFRVVELKDLSTLIARGGSPDKHEEDGRE